MLRNIIFGVFFILFLSPAQAGFLVEPYVGFEGGQLSARVTDYRTPLVGLRAGLRFAKFLALGLDVSHRFVPMRMLTAKELVKDATQEIIDDRVGDIVIPPEASAVLATATEDDENSTTQPSSSTGLFKSQMTDLALFLMLDTGLWVRAYAVYAQMFSAKAFETRGRNMRFGLSTTALPFVAINVEMARRKFDHAANSSTTYGLSLSVPLP